KLRPVVRRLFPHPVENRRGGRNASRRRYSRESARIVGREDNVAVAIPRAAFAGRSVADRLWSTDGCVDSPQLALREERDEPVIRRPEGKRRVVGPRQRLIAKRVETMDPELRRLA